MFRAIRMGSDDNWSDVVIYHKPVKFDVTSELTSPYGYALDTNGGNANAGRGLRIRGDTTVEELDVPAVDGSISNYVGLSYENWCRKEVTMVNNVGEGVASGFVELARAS